MSKVIPVKHHDEIWLTRPAKILYRESRENSDQELAVLVAKFENILPTVVVYLKRDLEASLTFYSFPVMHCKFIHTTNNSKRLFNEVKKRSHEMATVFRNESSSLLMFYAVIRSFKLRRISVSAKDTKYRNLHNYGHSVGTHAFKYLMRRSVLN